MTAERQNLLRVSGVTNSVGMILLALSALTTPLLAQEPATEAGARAAATQMLRDRPAFPVGMAIVADTAAVRAALTRCDSSSAGRVCALDDGRYVGLLLIRLITPTSAEAEYRPYMVRRHMCPGPDKLPAPIVGYITSETWRLVYADGRWINDRQGRKTSC